MSWPFENNCGTLINVRLLTHWARIIDDEMQQLSAGYFSAFSLGLHHLKQVLDLTHVEQFSSKEQFFPMQEQGHATSSCIHHEHTGSLCTPQ